MSTGRKRLLAYVIMVMSLMISIKLVKDIVKLWKSDDRLAIAEQELEVSKEESAELRLRLEEIETGEWWEKQVRNTLKMARENEKVVIVPDSLMASSSFERVESKEEEGDGVSNYQKWWKLFVY